MANKTRSFVHTLNRPIVVLLLLQLMGGIMLAPYLGFFPIYVKELGYSAIVISVIVAAKRVAGLAASLLGGTWSDTLGRKRTLLFGNIGFLLAGLVFFTPRPEVIGVLWALSGFGMGLHTLGGQSYLLDAADPDYLGLFSALFNWGYTLGGALSGPIVGFLLEQWGYGALGTALFVFALATIVINQMALPKSSVAGKKVTAEKLFGYGSVATRPPVLMLSALRFLPTFYYGMSLILVPLLLDEAGADKIIIAVYTTVSQVAASLGQVIVGRAADRFGPKWPTVVTFSTLVVSIFGIGAWPGRLWRVLGFGALGMAAAWSLSTLLPSLVAEATAPQERGRALGWIHLWWNLAMIVGAMTGGALFQVRRWLPFIVSGVLNVPSILLVFVFYRQVSAWRATGQTQR